MGRPALLYDADCAFCTSAARFGTRLGLHAQMVPLQSVDPTRSGINIARAQREIPFIDAHGAVSYGAAAIAGALGTGNVVCRVASWILRSWPVRRAADRIYGIVARNRHRMPGGSAACQIDRQSASIG